MAKGVKVFLFILFLFGAIVNAQENHLQKTISITYTNQFLPDALKQLSDRGGFLLSYNALQVDKTKRVSNVFKNEKVNYILNQILGRGYTYSVAGKHIIIRKLSYSEASTNRTASKSKGYQIRGYVVDDRGKKVPLATIYEVGELNASSTDEKGFFTLKSSKEWTNLYINKRHYRDTIIELFPYDTDEVIVQIHKESMIEQELVPIKAEIPFETKLPSLLLSEQQFKKTETLPLYETRKAQISFIPALGTNHLLSGLVANRFSFNILGGYAYAVNGFELGGLFNIIRQDVLGFQMAGFANLTGRNVDGFQVAGFANFNRGNAKGMQLSGFSNVVLDSLKGVQISGFSNVSGGSARGAQVSGFTNVSGRYVRGLQLAGFGNITNGDIRGLQIAGFGNYNRYQSNNVQIAGFINLANEANGIQIAGFSNFTYLDMHGIQISGFMNYAKRMKGIQLGLFNVCDTIRGIPIGLLSFVRKGYHVLEYSMNEQQAFTLAFKTGTHRFHNIVKVGQFQWENFNDLSFGYGLGTQQKIVGKLALELNVIGNGFYNTISRTVPNQIWMVSEFNLVFKPFRYVTLFAGPSLNYLIQDNAENSIVNAERAWQRLDDFQAGNKLYTGWMGYTFGLRFF